jgi:SAM-dependent methyltransferase
VHDAAARGFQAAADDYERARPDYPAEAIDRLIQELEIGRAARVLDLGAGTGKLTRMLEPTGARLVALDPVEAMAGRGDLWIRTYRDGGWAAVAITDTGPGIPDSVRGNLFDAYVTTKPVGQGSGLGLDNARRIVTRRHRGELTFTTRCAT